MSMSITWMILVVGLLLLAGGANFLIDGAAGIAKRSGVSALLIGLTIIAFGTSLPEIVIAITAAIHAKPMLAIGNVFGANIANIGLILGVAALIRPLQIESSLLRKELPLLFAVMLLVGLMLLKHELHSVDSLLLLFGGLAMLSWFVWQGIKTRKQQEALNVDYKKEMQTRKITPQISLTKSVFQILLGMALLPFGAHLTVTSATHIAYYFNISKLVIGLTIVAIGTTLPELAASLIGIIKKQDDMVIGNIIGSNMFNMLAVLAIPALTKPISLHQEVFYRDFLTMLGLSVVLYFFAFVNTRKDNKLTRIEALFLILIYGGYLAFLFK